MSFACLGPSSSPPTHTQQCSLFVPTSQAPITRCDCYSLGEASRSPNELENILSKKTGRKVCECVKDVFTVCCGMRGHGEPRSRSGKQTDLAKLRREMESVRSIGGHQIGQTRQDETTASEINGGAVKRRRGTCPLTPAP